MMNSAFAPHGFYPFEGQATTSLELIPLTVRHKLDCAEVKLHLSQWQALSVDERSLLLTRSCKSPDEIHAYRVLLNEMVERRYSVPATPYPSTEDTPWRDVSRWPEVVVGQCMKQRVHLPPTEHWTALVEADRHALFVLGRSRHSGAEFVSAMQLFFGV